MLNYEVFDKENQPTEAEIKGDPIYTEEFTRALAKAEPPGDDSWLNTLM